MEDILKIIRVINDKTITETAQIIGVSRSHFTRVELGEKKLSKAKVSLFAQNFDIDENFIYAMSLKTKKMSSYREKFLLVSKEYENYIFGKNYKNINISLDDEMINSILLGKEIIIQEEGYNIHLFKYLDDSKGNKKLK